MGVSAGQARASPEVISQYLLGRLHPEHAAVHEWGSDLLCYRGPSALNAQAESIRWPLEALNRRAFSRPIDP